MRHPAYPEYKESGVQWLGQVPGHWEVKRLRRLTYRVTDGAHVSPDLSSDDYPFVSTVDVKNGQIDFESCLKTSAESFYYLLRNGCKPFKGDVLFSKDGTVGRTAIVKEELDFIVASSLVIITPKYKELTAGYLDYFLNNALLKQEVELLMAGAALRRISIDKVGRLPCLLPSLPEQTAIADFLDRETGRIDTLVAKKRRLIALLGEKRTALISRTVTRGLPSDAAREFGLEPHTRFKDSGIEWLGEVPEGWDLKKVRHVARVIIGITYSPDDVVDESEGVLVLRASNVQNGKLSFNDNVYVEKEIKDSDRVKEGDILICSRNGSAHLVGKCALITADHAGYTFGAFMSVVRSDYGLYLYHFFNSDIFKAQSGLFSTSTINQLTSSTLENMVVAFPPKEEQIAIATYLDRETAKIDKLVEKVEAAIARLQEYRTALITAAVTGKIDVREYLASKEVV